MTTDIWFQYIGVGTVALLLAVNVADAAAHAFLRYALSTPEKSDDAKAKRILAAVDATREFVDTVVGILRPFKRGG